MPAGGHHDHRSPRRQVNLPACSRSRLNQPGYIAELDSETFSFTALTEESGGAAIACTTTFFSAHVSVLPRICVESRTTTLAAKPVPITFVVTEQAFRFGTRLFDHTAGHDPTFDEFTTARVE
ncbi:hypothetical protein G9444_0622 [Rhodococcus erythropolis]|jgi:hypothetical protein|uniref:Uncharacterized protein n=1 Tax=Rhodococcus erythropolis TaxID=1833 RepID=A0A6G9CME6_RHOER|nr:hypothetical protein G9444_0622 [Rhodococcus erythropolis]